MPTDERRRRSRWMIRALEWDDPRARYPNVWHEGMPIQVLAFDSVACRLRLGDLVATYHPASHRHEERAERFLGLSRVVSLRRAHDPRFAWVELETAHRFHAPLDLGQAPRRVFLCCDPGWPDREVDLFRKVFDAAVAEGWTPAPEETEEGAPPRSADRGREGSPRSGEGTAPQAPADGPGAEEIDAGPEPEAPPDEPGQPEDASEDGEEAGDAGSREASELAWAEARLFGGADFSGDMRDPREGTWLALLELRGDRLQVVRLGATGRTGLQACLRDSDPSLLRTEAIGLDFPFGLPLTFSETLLGGPFPKEGWWALARRLERMSRPEYLAAVQDFLEASGELQRRTDEAAGAPSPLHRGNPDVGAMSYHGIRMIAEERSRYALRPFETARGRLLLEVYPDGIAQRLRASRGEGRGGGREALIRSLASQERWPVEIGKPFRSRCLSRRDALDAVLAALCAARAVLSGEVERSPEELAGEDGERVRREGWIYGLGE